MTKKRRITRPLTNDGGHTLFLLIIGTTMAWSLTWGVISTTELQVFYLPLLLNVGLLLALFRLVLLNKYTLGLSATLLGISGLFLALDHVQQGELSALSQTMDFLHGLNLYLNGLAGHTPAYEWVLVWALTIAFSLVIFLLGYLWFHVGLLLAFGVVIFGLILTSGFFSSDMAFYVFILTGVLYLSKALHQGNKKALANYLPQSLILGTAAFLLAWIVPTPADGQAEIATERLITRPFVAMNEYLQERTRPRHFSLTQTGFGTGDVRRLGGDVVTNYNTVMRVRSTQPSLYLTGAILDTYTGYAWINQFEETEPLLFEGPDLYRFEQQSSLFNLFSLRDLRHTDTQQLHDFSREFFTFEHDQAHEMLSLTDIVNLPFDERELVVDTLEQATFTIFYGSNLLTGYDTGMEHQVFYTNQNRSLTARELLPRHGIYATTYLQLSDWIDIHAILAHSYPGILQDALDAVTYDLQFVLADGSTLSYPQLLVDHLIPRAQWIHETFTQLPEQLPQRVRDLATYVTQTAENNFEVAQQLQAFLRTFEYTLTPGQVPHDRDFVDYFLFDLQRGYCTFYASAFVVMARAMGLPARYIEGFIAIGNGNMDHYIYIRNRQGHAWAEVYFEGFGWYRFDPTPPSETFGTIFASPTLMNPQIDWSSLAFDDEFLWWDQEEHLFFQSTMTGQFQNNQQDIEIDLPVLEVVDTTLFQSVILQSALIVILLALGTSFLRVAYLLKKMQAVKHMPNRQAIVHQFHHVLACLQLLNYQRHTAETTTQFAKRIRVLMHVDGENYLLSELTPIYLKAQYSELLIEDRERELLSDCLASLESQVREDMGRFKFWAIKYLRGIGHDA